MTSQSANLGCILHDTADMLSNLAQPTNLTNLSQGLAYNQSFFGAVNHIAVPGWPRPRRRTRPTPSSSSCAPAWRSRPSCPRRRTSYPTPNTIPDILPGAGCITVYGHGVGPATQPGFVPAAGGHVVAPTAQESDVELGTGPRRPSISSAAYRVPRAAPGRCSRWAACRPGPVPGLGRPPVAPAHGRRA